MPEGPSAMERIEIVLAARLVICVPNRFKPEALRRVVATLTSPLP
jgi:hypothetical protein